MKGPLDTAFENTDFHLNIQFTADYPKVPPQIHFKPVLFHPNIDFDGRVCLEILTEEKWSTENSIEELLLCNIADMITSPETTP